MEKEKYHSIVFNECLSDKSGAIIVPVGFHEEERLVCIRFGFGYSNSLLMSYGSDYSRSALFNSCLYELSENSNIKIEVLTSESMKETHTSEIRRRLSFIGITTPGHFAARLHRWERIVEDRIDALRLTNSQSIDEYNDYVSRNNNKTLTPEEKAILGTPCNGWRPDLWFNHTIIFIDNFYDRIKFGSDREKECVRRCISTILKWGKAIGIYLIVSTCDNKSMQEEYNNAFDTEVVFAGGETAYDFIYQDDSDILDARLIRHGNIDTEVNIKVPRIKYKQS